MRKDNSGFSLVELIVVIAMMVILTAVGGAWIGRISGYRARECASKVTSSITSLKVQALSKAVDHGDVYCRIHKKSDGKYYVETKAGNIQEDIQVGKSSSLKISYTLSSGYVQEVTDSDELYISYARNTGALIYSPDGSNWYINVPSNEVKKISVSNGTRNYDIDIVAKTGKILGKH